MTKESHAQHQIKVYNLGINSTNRKKQEEDESKL